MVVLPPGVEVNRNLIPCHKSVDVHFKPRQWQLSYHLFSFTPARISLLDSLRDWGLPWGPPSAPKVYIPEVQVSCFCY